MVERSVMEAFGRERYEAGRADQQKLEQAASYRNWMLLAFRALNDADGVLETVECESVSEEELLHQLRERIGAIARQVPTLLRMGHAETKRAARGAKMRQPASGQAVTATR